MDFLLGVLVFAFGTLFGVLCNVIYRHKLCWKCRINMSSTYSKMLAQHKENIQLKDQEIARLHDALRNEQIKNAELLHKLSA